MDIHTSPVLRALFDTAISRLLLKADLPKFTILKANETYLKETLANADDVIGKGVFEIFNSNAIGRSGEKVLRDALVSIIRGNKHIKLPRVQYNLQANGGGKSVANWWDAELIPISLRDGGAVDYILISAYNITNQVENEQKIADGGFREDQLTEELTATNEELLSTINDLNTTQLELRTLNLVLERRISERITALAKSESSLRSLVMTAHYPLMILRGTDWIIEIANQPLVNLWDRTIEEVTGAKLMDILPEIEDQPFPGFLRQVYQTGVGYGQEEQVFYYNGPAGLTTKYVSFYYDPLLDEHGKISGIIVAAEDITAKVHSRKMLEESYASQQELNQEFSAINEELEATVEELSVSNEELMATKKTLESKNLELLESEERFRRLIHQAPVGICVIRASDLMIQELNDNYLEVVGKERGELENKTIWEAVAEAAESYAPVMQQVIWSGKSFVATEHEVMLIRRGKPEVRYLDFTYEPVKLSNGLVSSIMVVVVDVTDKVIARHSIEDVEERIRLAVNASGIGTFDFNIAENSMISSPRMNEIFGFDHMVPRDELLKVIHPEDLHLSSEGIEKAHKTGKLAYEARLLWKDGTIRWISVQANLYLDKQKNPVRLLGTVLDITEFKQLQQQKDDFISIASHELKTPITTLKASLQLLERMKDTPTSGKFPELLTRASRSMNKISELIEDLLNVSRMSEGQVKLKKSTFNIMDMLRDCSNHIRITGQHELILNGDEHLLVLADEHRIDQVVINLVNNAVKYAPSSKEIYLNAERENDMVKVTVRDTGPGIAPEKIPYLFERYYRADLDGESRVSGLGLGLYISADIIERHGGKIGVNSILGEGSSFWFTLPASE